MPRTLLVFTLIFVLACQNRQPPSATIGQWETHEIELQSTLDYENPYTDVEVWVEFSNGEKPPLQRPAFWDGGKSWKVRFASPDDHSLWQWKSFASNQEDTGLQGLTGSVQAIPYAGTNPLLDRGLLKMSPGKRNVIHADNSPFLLVGDTPWALPFRATKDQAMVYARDRQEKGFNAALLMTVQPDMKAEGPEARDTPLGFMRGFKDLSDGHINQLNPGYYQYLDSLIDILINHEIVPVYQPVFHGFGWKGLEVLGNTIEPEEYVRYCQYLLARYGSKPAFWLLAGDNGGRDPGVKEAGEMMESWDAYQQPTGLHYNPCDDYIAEWAIDNPLKHCEHYNKTFQAEDWLDFQWAQTGHSNEHQYHKVERMYANQPTKASANGEPTYEGMNNGQNGLGWWQGEEAWMQFMSGGTMGVVYGAAGLWQWKVSPDEAGWTSWADQPESWEGAMQMEGSKYVGLFGKALEGLDITDIEKGADLIEENHPLLAKEDKLFISYLNQGGRISFKKRPKNYSAKWYNPQSGKQEKAEIQDDLKSFIAPDESPWVLIFETK
jgi:hypothetical protein